jgi:hypothetical protein
MCQAIHDQGSKAKACSSSRKGEGRGDVVIYNCRIRNAYRTSRATSTIISAAVIWYRVLFRQNHTCRPSGQEPLSSQISRSYFAGVFRFRRKGCKPRTQGSPALG